MELFGDAVCHHLALLHFRTFEDQQQSVYVPTRYREQVEYIIAGLEVARTIRECDATPPATAATVLHQEYFEFAQVARARVRSVGADFDRIARSFDAESQQRGARVMQFSLNLGEAAVERAVELLRNRGYATHCCHKRCWTYRISAPSSSTRSGRAAFSSSFAVTLTQSLQRSKRT